MPDSERPHSKSAAAASAAELRRQAEESVGALSAAAATTLPGDVTAVDLELRVHQVELEMQGEELRRANLELDVQRAKYFDLFDLAPVGYLTLSEKNIIRDANLTAARLLGVERQQLVGRPLRRFIAAPDQDLFYWHRVLLERTGEPQDLELRLQPAVGEPVWVHLAWRPRAPTAGEPDTTAVTFTDVTAAHAAEEKLRASEARFRLATENSAIGMCLVSPDGGFLTVNPALCAMLGRDAETLSAATWQELTHPDDLRIDLGHVQDILDGRIESYRMLKRFLRPDGSIIWGDLAVACVRNDDGSVRHFISQIVDVTATHAAEEALRESEERYRLLADNATDIIFLGKPDSTLQWISPSVRQVLGLAPEDLVGRPAMSLIHPDDLADVRSQSQRANRDGFGRFEARYRQADGGYRWMSVQVHAVTDEHGTVTARTGIARDIDAEHQAREALAASEKRFRALFHNAPLSGVVYRFVRDPAGEIVDWEIADINEGGAATIGVPAEALPGRRATELFGADAMAGYLEISRDVARTGSARTWEEHFALNDRTYLTSVFMAGDDLYANVSVDISDLRRAQEGTRLSEERFRTMFDVAPLGIALVDTTSGRVYRANDRYLAIAGRTRDELETFDWMAVTHPDDLAVELGLMDRLRAGEIPSYLVEKRQYRPDGSVRWDLKAVAPMAVSDPADPRFLAMVADVTAQKEAEAALRFSEAELAEGQRVAHVGSWTWDPVADVVEWSDELFRIFGLQPASIAPSFTDEQVLFTPESARQLNADIARARAEGSTYRTPIDIVRPDGVIRHAIARGEVAAGPPERIRGTLVDVTELREAQNLLDEAQTRLDQAQRVEMVGRLAGGVAHDFNNLLAVINGYAEFLVEGLSAGDPKRADAEAILDAGLRAASITSELLAFGRGQVLQPTVLDVRDAVGWVTPMLFSVVGGDVEIEIRHAEPIGRVRVDRTRLEQVVVNLVLNARDAMPRGGVATIATTCVTIEPGDRRLHPPAEAGDYVCLAVTDTGTGIAPDVLPHVFEPFFTTKPFGAGSGLGLASVEGIVAQSGGFMTVESEVGRGTTFSVFLPRTSKEPAAAPPPHARPVVRLHPTATGRETVLLVEDEPGVLAVTARTLRELGYRVLNAGDPTAALAIAEGTPAAFDILVTDVVMPGMSGRVLSDRLTALRRGLPVLFMSGYAPDKVFGEGLLEEGTPFLAKPFLREDLARRVRELLDQRAAADR